MRDDPPMRSITAAAALLAALSLHAQPLQLAPGVHLLRGTFSPGSQPDGNSVIFEGRRGFVVVDTGRHAAHTGAIASFVERSGRPLVAILNTHWHLDHLGGNLLLRERFPDVEVYASDAYAAARKGFLARSRESLVQQLQTSKDDAEMQKALRHELALIDAGDALAPDAVIGASRRIRLAGRRMRVGLENNAVTAGDVWLFDPSSKILVAGDLVTLPAPFLDTACPSGWQQSLQRLGEVEFETLVPGHGAPMTRDQFGTYRKAFDSLLACASSDMEKGACTDGWLRDAETLIEQNDRNLARMMIDYYVEEHLRKPERTKVLCGE